MTKSPLPETQSESSQAPHFLRQLSPQMIALLEQHFWADFSDVIPALTWEQDKPRN